MLHVYKSDISVAVLGTLSPLKYWLRSIDNRRIVWTCIFEAAGSEIEGNISYNYRFYIVTLQMTNVVCSEIRRIRKRDV